MARSVGEAAALGLESGFRLAMDVNDSRDRKARQQKLDDQSEADRERTQRRQDEADQLAALSGQEQMLATEGAGLAARATPPDEATQRDFTARVEGVRTAKGSLLAKRSGFDPLKAKKDAQADIEALKSGNIAALSPGGLTRAATVSTGRPPADYIRANGQASPIELAGQDFVEGMQAGDEPRMLKGLNFLFQPQLQKGIGEKSPHGGMIVGKQIAGVIPDPNSDPNDPRVIPTLRVYVNNGKKEDSGDEVRARRAMADGAPAGATGYYLAPLTEGRSSDPNDKVKSIGMTQAMDYIGQHLQLAEILNTPDALARMKEEQDSGAWDSQQYLAALAGVGATPKPKFTTKETVIPAGASVKSTITDASGRVVEERITQGNPKTRAQTLLEKAQELADANGTEVADEYAKLRRSGTSMQDKLDAVDADQSLTPKEREIEKRAIRSGIKPGKYTGDSPGAGGGGQAGAGVKVREQDRKELKDKFDRADKAADNAETALRDFRRAFPDGPPSARNPKERQAYDSELSDLTAKAKKARQRADDFNKDLDAAETPAPATGGLAAEKGGSGKGGGLVLKFDKTGKLVR